MSGISDTQNEDLTTALADMLEMLARKFEGIYDLGFMDCLEMLVEGCERAGVGVLPVAALRKLIAEPPPPDSDVDFSEAREAAEACVRELVDLIASWEA